VLRGHQVKLNYRLAGTTKKPTSGPTTTLPSYKIGNTFHPLRVGPAGEKLN
jgi:hypothetical protein